MICSSRPPAASSRARACAFINVSRSSARRSARQPIAGFSSASGLVFEIGQALVAADVDGAEDDRLVAGGVEHRAVEPLLRLALGQGRRDQELEFGAEQADPVGAGRAQSGDVVAEARIDHHRDAQPVPGHRRLVLDRGIFGAALLRHRELGVERILDRRGRADDRARLGAVEQDEIALGDRACGRWRSGRSSAHPSRGRRSSHGRSRSLPRGSRPSACAGHIRAIRRGRDCARSGSRRRACRPWRRCRAGRRRSGAAGSRGRRDRASGPASRGSSIWRMRCCMRWRTRSIAASAVRPLSIASLIRRDQPSS